MPNSIHSLFHVKNNTIVKPLPPSEYSKQADSYEKQFKWLEAANQYQKALTHDLKAETMEKQANALFRAAYQSQNKTKFKEMIRVAKDAYSNACELYDEGTQAKNMRCQSFSVFLSSILEEQTEKRKQLLDDCLDLDLKALEECRTAKDVDCYIETCESYLLHILWRSDYSYDHHEVKSYIEDAYEAAAYIFDIGEERGDLTCIRQYLSAILLDKPMEVFDSIDIQKGLMETSSENAQKAYNEATEKQDQYLIGKSALTLGHITFEVKGDLESSLELVNQALVSAEMTQDNWLLAHAHELYGYLTAWHVNYITDDPKSQDKKNQEAFEHTEKAIELYHIISKPISLAYMNHIGYHYHSARNEPNLGTKLEYTRKGMTVGYRDLEEAKRTGSELGSLFVLNELLHLMFGLIKYTEDESQQRGIIQETEKLIDEVIDVSTRIQPFRIWNISVFKFQAARLKIARAGLEESPEEKVALLLEALEVGEECVELSKAHLEANPSPALSLDYAVGIRQIGELLISLHSTTKDPNYLERAISTYTEVLEIYQKNELFCREAEIHWKIATLYESIGKYIESAEAFDRASTSYKMSSDKMPHLKEFYLDYSTYMEAWGEITRAKLHNVEERYEKVNELYTRAAALHASTSRWDYLSSNYEAWAQLADAEKMSQEGQSTEAIDLFTKVVDIFSESREKIQEIYPTIGMREEQEMAQRLISASDRRISYCLGRVSLEEAKLLSKSDEHSASARKYRESVNLFQDVLESDLSSPERNEIIPILTLCNAWEMMELAEAESSPERYEAAARLFMDAKDLCYTNRTRLLSMGHSNFCSALYECTKFETSRNNINLQNATKYLTNATNFYLRAGFDDAMEYSKATLRLYESYMYMDYAGSESQPDEKARFYLLAERLLAESAQSFERANHPVKQQEVTRLLDYVRRERRLALSLIQVLNAPNIASSTMSFIPPSPTSEYPAGLESFDHGNIQTTMHIKDTDLRSGEKLSIMLEMTNTGMSVATLKGIIDLPEADFASSGVSGLYSYNDGRVDLRSKRLAPLSSETVTITMNPRKRGEYTIKPCIEYEDETGESRVCETEAIGVAVGELGLRGWLMGPKRKA